MAHGGSLIELVGVKRSSIYHWDYHPLVGLSSLCFCPPASAFLAVWTCLLHHVSPPYSWELIAHLILYPFLGVGFIVVALTSLFADCLYIRRAHRSWYGKIDIRVASVLFFACILDFSLRASLIETAGLILLVVLAFIHSGNSSSFEQWVWRHSLWHVVAGGETTYGALRLMPGGGATSSRLRPYLVCFLALNATLAAMLLGALACLGAERRRALWERGASLADWHLVPGARPDDCKTHSLLKSTDDCRP